jgi:4-hydroxybenzoyl-CoA reductase beta subunit
VGLPDFEYLEPETFEETLEMLAVHKDKATLLAGGTDLIVRMKKRLAAPAALISLKNLHDLNYIHRQNGDMVIGAMTPLVSIGNSEMIKRRFHALAQAVSLIGAPTLQHFRGTIGGNLCLDTRCLYYNQSAFWRSGRTPCHKDHGETCYAEKNSDRCRSANQSDGACALTALEATVLLASKRGKRSIPVEDFFSGRGETPFTLDPDEMVAEIRLPFSEKKQESSFQKLAYRSALDFALVASAVRIEAEDGRITKARIVVGGAGAAPLLLKEASERLVGKAVHDPVFLEEAQRRVSKHASPFMVDNLGSTLPYRRKMSGTMARKALRDALERLES